MEKKSLNAYGYDYARGILGETDPFTGKHYSGVAFLIYQLLMELFSLRKECNETEYSVKVSRLMYDAKNIYPGEKEGFDYNEFFRLTNEFVKLGYAIYYLLSEEEQKIFAEIKKRRNDWLNKQKTLRAFLIGEKDFETDDVYNAGRANLLTTGLSTLMDNGDDNFRIELKKGVNEDEVNRAIREYYERRGYTTKINLSIEVFDANDGLIKWVTATILPGHPTNGGPDAHASNDSLLVAIGSFESYLQK